MSAHETEWEWEVRVTHPDGRSYLLNISPKDEKTARMFARHDDSTAVRRPVGEWEDAPPA